jgi:hypothetical protein
MSYVYVALCDSLSKRAEGVKIAVGIYNVWFRHEFQPLILIRNLTIFTPNADGLKACENAYILVGFIFNVRNKLLLCYATEIQKYITFSKSRLAAHVNTRI